MSDRGEIPVDRRTVLKATGGIAGGTALGSGRAVASLGNSTAVGDDDAGATCFDPCRPITREERRLFVTVDDGDEESPDLPEDEYEEVPIERRDENEDEEVPVAQRILEESGFDEIVDEFMGALCDVDDGQEAIEVIEEHGLAVWEAAVERAQGDRDNLGDAGTIPRYDSRPLYWARLKMAAAIRQWDPEFRVVDEESGDLHGSPRRLDADYGAHDEVRDGLVERLEYTSRGLTSTTFPDDEDVTRVIVSGFDTFGLGSEIRRLNPSAASVLRLDGRRLETSEGPVHVEAVVFPVRWEDFDQGIVEDAFGPHLADGSDERQADLLVTISQGERALQNPELFAASWRRGARYGNNLGTREGYVPEAPGWPQPDERIDWIETTLPIDAMTDVEEAPWEVALDETVVGWANGDACPDPRIVPVITQRLVSQEGSVDGLLPFAGGGGNYLSNESMYRSNRLRLALGLEDFPGGHLHVSSVRFEDGNATALTDTRFEAELTETVDQTVDIVAAAAAAVD
jgi:hypothetical protein